MPEQPAPKLNDHIRVIRGRRKGSEGYVVRENADAIGFRDLSRNREPLTWILRHRLATDVEIVAAAEDESPHSPAMREDAMNRTAHTPGPWTYSVEQGETLLANGNIVIASFRDGNEPCEADARLIAHAPAMLDYLRRYVAASSNVGPFPKEARALLRAVEGA